MASREEPTDPLDLLGHHVVDVLNGVNSIAIGYREDLYGCYHFLLEPSELLKDGSVALSYSVDEQRIQFVKRGPARKGKIKRAQLPLGSKVKHKVHGLEGISVSRMTWVNHKPTTDVEPLGFGRNGEKLDIIRFDEDMLEVIEEGGPKFSETFKKRVGMTSKTKSQPKKRGIGSIPEPGRAMPFSKP